MPKYILKRIVGTIPTLIIVVTFVFFFVRLIPGDPARLVAGEQMFLSLAMQSSGRSFHTISCTSP